jgi:hypothetical protein
MTASDHDVARVAALFDVPPEFLVPIPNGATKLSPDRRRVLRQAEAMIRGGHPLALVSRDVRVHPEADGRNATRDNAKQRPLRCGTCLFREVISSHGRGYPKCMWPGPPDRPRSPFASPRFSHGAATDIRAWWPACTDFQPQETAT